MQVDRATVDANMARIHASLSPAELEALAEAGDEVYSVSSASPDNVEAAPPVKSAETIAAEEVATDAAAAGAKAADTEPQAEPPKPSLLRKRLVSSRRQPLRHL